jgi:hypothetical protein
MRCAHGIVVMIVSVRRWILLSYGHRGHHDRLRGWRLNDRRQASMLEVLS